VHPFIPTFINTGKERILFDTGNGALARDYPQLRSGLSDGLLVERLAQIGYNTADIDIVVVTHGHPDHIGGLIDGGKPVFPKARYVFGAAEFDFWKRGENVPRRANSISSYSRSSRCRSPSARPSSSPAMKLHPEFVRSTRPGIRPACSPITSRAAASAC